MFKKIGLHPFVFFPLVTCIFFWPITLHLFTFKNDALTYYYPIRTLISDALQNGELPLWTPFINMGYPLHADMQSGACNPIIWFFSCCTNYSLAGFHAEMLLYFSFAGIGFYYLCTQMGWHKTVCIILALCYQFSGFMLDSVQFFVCISAACYLPFVLLFLYKMLTNGGKINALSTGFFLSLMLTGSYPAMFIITFYFLLSFCLFIFFNHKKKWAFVSQKWLLILITTFTFFLMSLPAIISFIQHLPFIDRGKQQSLAFVQQNSFVPLSLISLISPFSTTATAAWLPTDALMRNAYMGILPLIFILYGLKQKIFLLNKTALFFLASGVVFFLIAFGHYFFMHQLLYSYLPLINTFRHPALFRLFAIFSFLMFAGFGFNAWVLHKNFTAFKQVIKLHSVIVTIITVLLFIIFFNSIVDANWYHLSIKKVYHQYLFIQRYLLQLPIIILLISMLWFKKNQSKIHFFLIAFCLIDLFLAVQLNIPATVIGSKSMNEVNTLLNRNKVLFPLPTHNSITQNSANTLDTLQLYGSTLPFIKKIGRNDYFITPGNLTSQQSFFASANKNYIFAHELLYFDEGTINIKKANPKLLVNYKANTFNNQIDYTLFSANSITAQVQNSKPEKLVFLQNYYPGWQATIDGNNAPIEKVHQTFMAIQLSAGKHLINFTYAPMLIIYSWYIAIAAMIIFISIILFSSVHWFFNNRK